MKSKLMTQQERLVFSDLINHYKTVSVYLLETLIIIQPNMIEYNLQISHSPNIRTMVDI